MTISYEIAKILRIYNEVILKKWGIIVINMFNFDYRTRIYQKFNSIRFIRSPTYEAADPLLDINLKRRIGIILRVAFLQ
jgi:hypothetical protein